MFKKFVLICGLLAINPISAMNYPYLPQPSMYQTAKSSFFEAMGKVTFFGLSTILLTRAAYSLLHKTAPVEQKPQAPVRTYHQFTFKNLAGSIPRDVLEITEFINNNEKYRAMGARMPKGILLVGPPGTGKTSIARAIAGETDAYFIPTSATNFIEMWVGVGPARVRALFNEARQVVASGVYKKAIIFIDELDSIGCKRTANTYDREHNDTLNELLNQMDGFTMDNSIFVIAATNRIHDIDEALKRPGRFDRIAYIGLPDKESREALLKHYSQTIKADLSINYQTLAIHTDMMSAAEIANLVNESAIRAVRENAPCTTQRHFEDALSHYKHERRALLVP